MTGSAQPPYRGRFAPSPTGPLHFGSLVAAVGSWADARAHGGEWLVRMEDLDPPREVPGAADEILRTLEALGLEPDGPVVRQSERGDAYRAALDRLRDRGVLFACGCTRREIADSGLPGSDGGLVYPGTCRNGPPPGRPARALRVRVDDAVIAFDDALQGRVSQDLGRDVGDFVLLRADGFFAYQLAVVVDDAAQGITDVVRGIDLIDSTPRQIFLQRAARSPDSALSPPAGRGERRRGEALEADRCGGDRPVAPRTCAGRGSAFSRPGAATGTGTGVGPRGPRLGGGELGPFADSASARDRR